MFVSPRTVLNRLLLVLLGLCTSLLVIEGVLQVGSLFVGRKLLEQPVWVGKWRMLCLGDSNTYGVYVDKSQAYPKVFEATWNQHPENQQVEVLNLGFPGTNSSKLVKDFRRMLWTFRPDVVTIMIGVNDLWTVPETAAESPNRMDRLAAALWRVSRAYRFLYMLRRAVQIRELEVTSEPSLGFQHGHGTGRYGKDEFELGWTQMPKGGIPDWRPAVELEKNLETLARQAPAFGIKLIFLTYASDSKTRGGAYAWANRVVRSAATATGTSLIDVAAMLKPACPDPTDTTAATAPASLCPELLPDQHPSVLGHEKVGEILAQQLPPALAPAR